MARDPYRYFRIEARELTDQLGQSMLELEREGSGGEVVPRLLRLAHTLKGAARVVRLPEIADHAHSIEDLLGPYRGEAKSVPRDSIEALLQLLDSIAGHVSGLAPPEAPATPTAASSVRPAIDEPVYAGRGDISEIDGLLEGLVEANAQLGGLRDLAQIADRARRLSREAGEQLAVLSGAGPAIASIDMLRNLTAEMERAVAATHSRIDRELRQVRDAAEQLRLVPAGALFSAFERAARDSAQALGKQVAFSSRGADIRLDVQIVRLVQDAVLQLVRNAVAHGIEAPAGRRAAGKQAAGEVGIDVLRRGRYVVFSCHDDGAGIDVAALRAAAIAGGRSASDLDRLSPDRLVHELLKGGISTSPMLSEVAGRGIGMDIVRDAVARLGASFEVHTEPGRGTRFDLIVPLLVSAVDALLLEAAGQRATLPVAAIRQTVRLGPHDIHHGPNGESIIHAGEAIPLVPLARLLGRAVPPRRADQVSAVIVAAGRGLAAVSVARLPGTANVVLRSLPPLAPASPVVAGASFDAGGNPLLMLDPDGVVAMAHGQRGAAPEAAPAQQRLLVIDDSLTTRMLEQSILESAGYQVDVAVSAEEGLERVRSRNDYLLILCDVEMPGMDGFGFVEQLRADPRLRDIPAILVTSRNAPEDKRRGHDVGAQGYVVKSEFDQAELLGRIKQLVA